MKSLKLQPGALHGERPGVNPGIPEYEAGKAARRCISHHDAVEESDYLQKQYYRMWGKRPVESPVELSEIFGTLTAKRIPFVLIGTHAIGGWSGRPRATQDLDLLVRRGRNHSRAVKAIEELYPNLEVRNFVGVTGFSLPGEKECVIDVVYPYRADLEEMLANTVLVEPEGLRYRIPSLEAALANKYGAMRTMDREITRRVMDAVDFSWMVAHSMDPGQTAIDLEKLRGLGEKVWPSGGGEEILSFVEEAKAGGVPSLDLPQPQ